MYVVQPFKHKAACCLHTAVRFLLPMHFIYSLRRSWPSPLRPYLKLSGGLILNSSKPPRLSATTLQHCDLGNRNESNRIESDQDQTYKLPDFCLQGAGAAGWATRGRGRMVLPTTAMCLAPGTKALRAAGRGKFSLASYFVDLSRLLVVRKYNKYPGTYLCTMVRVE